MEATPHLAFIVAAYGAAVGVVVALTAWVMIDRRLLLRTLAELDRRGVSRRSAAQRNVAAMNEAKEEA
jgi:heme exporter protein D